MSEAVAKQGGLLQASQLGRARRHAGRRHRGAWLWPAAWLLVCAASLIAKILEPPYPVPWAITDDSLLVHQAGSLISGSYSQLFTGFQGPLVLAKPQGYALFLFITHYLSLPPAILQHLVYLTGALLIAGSWLYLRRSQLQSLLLLVFLALNPYVYDVPTQTTYRDGFICALGTFAIGLSGVISCLAAQRYRALGGEGQPTSGLHRRLGLLDRHRAAVTVIGLVLLVVALGLCWGWLGVTKESWYWILPASAALVFYPVAKLLLTLRSWRLAAGVLGLCALSLVTAIGAISFDKAWNQRHYGVNLVADLNAGAQKDAFAAWASVKAGQRLPYIPVTEAMRQAVYKVSPTARLMEPWLESKSDVWRIWGCEFLTSCHGESNAFFIWDMRSAAVASGRIKQVKDFQTFFGSLATEIKAACADGSLRCSSSPVLATGLIPLDQINKAAVLRKTVTGVHEVLGFQQLLFGVPTPPPGYAGYYPYWQAYVPGTPSYQQARLASFPSGLLHFLDADARILRLLTEILLIPGLLGVLYFPSRRRRQGFNADLMAADAARLFLLTTAFSFGSIAIFAVAAFPTYMNAEYWADFTTPAFLMVLFGAFAFAGGLRNLLGERVHRRRSSRSADDASPARKPSAALQPSGSSTTLPG